MCPRAVQAWRLSTKKKVLKRGERKGGGGGYCLKKSSKCPKMGDHVQYRPRRITSLHKKEGPKEKIQL